MPLPLIAIAAGIAISGTASAWYYNYRTREEQKQQAQLKERLRQYGDKYEDLINSHAENIRGFEREAFEKIKNDFISQIEYFRTEKAPIKNELEELRKAILIELERPDISPYQKKSLIWERNRVDDAFYRLDAYWNYLDWFQNQLKDFSEKRQYLKVFDMGPPDALLPQDYLYIGKLGLIEPDELNKWNLYSQNLQLVTIKKGDNYCIKREEEKILDYYIKSNIKQVPVLIENANKNRYYFYVSIAKGEIYLNILSGSSLEVKPLKNERPNQSKLFVQYKGVNCFIKRENKQFPLKRYRETYSFSAYVLENDFLLKSIELSEKRREMIVSQASDKVIVLYDDTLTEDILQGIDNSLQNSEISIVEANFEEKRIRLKAGDINLGCSIFNDICLKVDNVSKENIDTSKSFTSPFLFIFIPQKAFEEDLYLDLKESFVKFLNFVNTQIVYSLRSKESQRNDFEFIQNWSDLIDYQISENSNIRIEEKYEKAILNDYLELKVSNLKTIQKEIEKRSKSYPVFKEKPVISVECKLPDKKYFEYIDVGELDDINYDDLTIRVKADLNDVELSGRKNFILKIPIPHGALIRQRQAIKDFIQGKIVNEKLKPMLISPTLVVREEDSDWKYKIDKITWFNEDLTNSQKELIINALTEKNLFLIQGPPGTGKTTIIKEITYQFLKSNPTAKLLIVSQQNVAVDNALERIHHSNRELFDSGRKSLVRIAPDESKVSENLRKFTIDNWFADYKVRVSKNFNRVYYEKPNTENLMNEWWSLIDKENFKDIDNEIIEVLINSHQIVGATCVGLANKNIGLNLMEFDIVIVDEAGRATPPEILIPILKGQKVILIGDHYQLPPSTDRKLLEKLEEDDSNNELTYLDKDFLEKSFFERLYESVPDTNKGMLIEQFRMPQQIGDLISELFYHGKIINGMVKSTEGFVDKQNTIRWDDVEGKQELDGTSSYNLAEIERIVQILKTMHKYLLRINGFKTVAVITPYSAQKRRLKRELDQHNFSTMKIKIDTVDSFQGEEAQIVIYSTVKTRGNLSFIIDKRRLNVAISRTQENLIFVGHKKFLFNAKVEEKRNLFREIISLIDRNKINGNVKSSHHPQHS